MPSQDLVVTNAVLGCSDIALTARFWAALGFTQARSERIPADLAATLYGARGPLDTLAMSVPESNVGWIRLVEADGSPPAWQPHRRGRSVLEIFASDLDSAEDRIRSAGALAVGRTEFSRGDRWNREVRLLGPDQVEIGLTQSSTTAAAPLLVAGRGLTELVNILWLVDSVEEARAGLPELAVLSEQILEAWGPAHEFLGLPDPLPAIGMATLGGPRAPFVPLQLLQVTGRTLEVEASRPIHPGVIAVGCEGAVGGPTGVERAGGVRLEIWPDRS